jgi:hypothetical protein
MQRKPDRIEWSERPWTRPGQESQRRERRRELVRQSEPVKHFDSLDEPAGGE